MEFTIWTRKLKREVTFSRPGNFYIYVDLNGQPGTLGEQICDGGYLGGDTIGYGGDSQEEFEDVCRRWWRAYINKI